MSRVAIAAAAFAVLGGSGCQTFIGIEDVEGHLPRLDGDYLVGLKRVRADATTEDTIRLVGNARLDPDTRELRLSLNMLSATTGQSVSENAITGVIFEDDSTEATFDLSIEIRPDAVLTPLGAGDDRVSARMVVRAEGDYAFCAVPEGGAALPSIGTILIAPGTVTPEVDMFDTVCDVLQPE